jgi:hypothetical protein
MESEGSLSCSQKPSTGPYPEPDQSSPYHPILSLLKIIFHVQNLISIFFSLGRLSRLSVQVWGLFWYNKLTFFTAWSC